MIQKLKDPCSLFGSEIYVLLNESLRIRKITPEEKNICFDQCLGKYYRLFHTVNIAGGFGEGECLQPSPR